MVFLLFTAITGIAYIITLMVPEMYNICGKLILRMHAYLSLYGWNLSGILVIMRQNDFPLRLNSIGIIILHWVIIVVLVPLGSMYIPLSALSVVCYCIFLSMFLLWKDELAK